MPMSKSEIMSFYSGLSSNKKIHHVNRVEREKEDFIFEEELFSVNIYYDDKDIPYVFGRDCITESMAYLVESNSFDGYKRQNELPYNSCELISQLICPNLLKKKKY